LILFAAGISVFVFYDDIFNPPKQVEKAQAYAMVVELDGQTNLKKRGSLHWVKLKKGLNLELGDQIYVGEKSNLVLQTLSEKIFVKIQANTLLTINQKMLGVEKGVVELKVEPNKKFFLNMNDNKFEIVTQNESDLQVGKETIELKKGDLNISNDVGQMQLTAGQKLKVEKNGTLKLDGVKKIFIDDSLVQSKICAEGKTPIKWKSEVPVDKYKVSIYPTALSKKPLKEFTQKNPVFFPTLSRFSNRYFFSIYGLKKGKIVSALEQRTEVTIINVNLIPKAKPKKPVFVQGEKLAFDDKTINEMESDEDLVLYLTKGRKKINASEINYDSSEINKGVYKTSICYESKACPRKCVNGKTLKIKDLGLPNLIYPPNGEVITSAEEVMDINFIWNNAKGITYDDLQIELVNKVTKEVSAIPVLKSSSGKNQKKITNMQKSKYKWSLKGFIGDISFNSKTNHFVISDTNIFKNLSENYIKTSKGLMTYSYSWEFKNKAPLKKIYHQTRINNKQTESVANAKEVKNLTLYRNSKRAEKFEWRLVTKSGNKIDSSSKWKKVFPPKCKVIPKLDPPIVTYIEADGEVVDNPIFRWKKVNGAREYRITLTSKSDSSNQIVQMVKGEQFEWSKPQLGTFYWVITPIDTNGVTCRSSKRGTYKKN
jgi:hypothetical protein